MQFEESVGEDQEFVEQAEDFLDALQTEVDPTIITKKDAVIFLVDCQSSLFKKLDDKDETNMHKIMKSLSSFLKSKIISNPEDKVGLVYFNVQKTLNPLNFKYINIVYEPESPSAERIKNCLELTSNFNKNYGFSSQEAMLHECLWLCNHLFKNLDPNKYSMRIFLFTPNDNPFQNNQSQRTQAIHHAHQLSEMNVQIELFPVQEDKSKVFDIRKFYTDIITIDIDEMNETVLDVSSKILDFENRLRQKEFKKRSLNRLLLNVGEETQIGLKVFCLVNKAKKPLGKQLDKRTNQPLKKQSKILCKDTATELFPQQIGNYCAIGDEKIPISKADIKAIKTFEPPGIRLIGFKDRKFLKDYYNYRASYFLYPDDEHVQGSSQFADALIKNMISKNKIAIVRFMPREGAQVRFCALIAQDESYDQDHFQTPPGFHLIFLPYADDIRDTQNVTGKQEVRVNQELVNVGKILVNALSVDNLEVRNFQDCSLQNFYNNLEAFALQENQVAEVQDLLQPDNEGFEKYNDIIELFQQALDLECGRKPQTKKGGKKATKKQMEEEDEEVKPVKKRK